MQHLEVLQSKLEQLLKHYATLQGDKDRLNKTVAQQAEIISQQKLQLSALQREIESKSVVLSASGADAGDKERLKSHLDKVIREIEKNIELL